MGKIYFRFFLLITLAFSAVRCAREVFIDLPEATPLTVVTGHFTAGEVFRVRVSRSQLIHETGDPLVPEDAVVKLMAEGEVIEQLHPVRDPVTDDLYWESVTTAQPGTVYTISAEVPDMPMATASSSIPPFTDIAEVVLPFDSFQTEPLTPRLVRLRIPLILEVPEMPAENRFFGFYFRHEIIRYTDTTFQEIDQVYEVSGSPFSTDGGTFSLLYSLTEPTVLIQEKYWNNNRRTLSLDVLIAYEPPLERPNRLMIEWRTMSNEFYRYYLSLARQSGSPALSDPDALYNHVQNGLGNFSGYAIRVDTLAL